MRSGRQPSESHSDGQPDCGLTRRQFLRTLGVAAAGMVAAGCLPDVPLAPATASPQVAPQATVPVSVHPTVAVAQAASYDRALVRGQVQTLLDGLGGLKDLIQPRARVAIKVNLTGGVRMRPFPGVSPVNSFATHPEVVRALCELLVDAGAGALTIVEAVYQWDSYSTWGYADMAGPYLRLPTGAIPQRDKPSEPGPRLWFGHEPAGRDPGRRSGHCRGAAPLPASRLKPS